jgi:hypothetical protein
VNEGPLVLAFGFPEKEVLRATKDCRAVARKSRRDRSNIVRVRFSLMLTLGATLLRPTMSERLLTLVFRCRHRRLTRPFTPVKKGGVPLLGKTYVVCLDCGQQFAYDLETMRVGGVLQPSNVGGC